jgi:hypothetical protein
MTDYSEAAANAEESLLSSSDAMIEEYEIRSNARRVKRGKLLDQVQTANRLEAFAARRASGLFRLGKPRNPRL